MERGAVQLSDLTSLLNDLRRHEGLRLKPYSDPVGVLSIGYGTNLSEGISIGEAETLLIGRAQKAIRGASSLVSNWIYLTDKRQNCLGNMVYNMGLERVAKFQKMLAAIEANDWDEAANEMLNSQWATQVGQRAIELAEAMRNG